MLEEVARSLMIGGDAAEFKAYVAPENGGDASASQGAHISNQKLRSLRLDRFYMKRCQGCDRLEKLARRAIKNHNENALSRQKPRRCRYFFVASHLEIEGGKSQRRCL